MRPLSDDGAADACEADRLRVSFAPLGFRLPLQRIDPVRGASLGGVFLCLVVRRPPEIVLRNQQALRTG